ncbi:Tat (twin-arginine translocation) pathway signal sequence [Actinosynnema sp. ALI-1.44]|uniref:sugar phosphate isomerase/epimerase family protein n=1 Tax=Actinosynnema sp. ALI-1.44 TaxID=1933779 RepID=UPI00097C0FF6|nr:sugar phosphate isomerase/epimerase [Actinosynnema sp. ALI-1.44]ONI87421.1 Tat (twin-arginine translocation) pathway signal sequence [Actinosynnema sp. ALI-1.44]
MEDNAQQHRRFTRRDVFTASASAAAVLGAAGLPILATATPALADTESERNRGRGLRAEPLIPSRNRGIILYSVRDRITAAPDNTGVPYGFERVLARLAEVGYKEIEFAGYTQHTSILGRQITPKEIRKILDDNGLVANGTHTQINPATFDKEMDIAQELGMRNIGTGGDPANTAYKSDWDAAADTWNELGRRAKARGLRLYTHNHDAAYGFMLDTGPSDANGKPTRSSGQRRLEYFFDKTDPRYVFFEMDIYWAYVARYKHKTYTDRWGRQQTDLFDPILTVAPRTTRFPLFHAKDGNRNTAVPDGHDMVVFGEGDLNFQQFFQTIGEQDFHHANWEHDGAPGGPNAPGQSLDFATRSYANMAELTIYRR